MYNVIKSVIDIGGFKLADIQHKIKKLYALGDLTEVEMDQLLMIASNHVSFDAERPETLAMLQTLSTRMDAIESRLVALEGGNTESEPDSGDVETYPAWAPWDGISNQYQSGAIVSHGGKLWQSTYAGQNVWEPGAAGIDERFWVEYTPTN